MYELFFILGKIRKPAYAGNLGVNKGVMHESVMKTPAPKSRTKAAIWFGINND